MNKTRMPPAKRRFEDWPLPHRLVVGGFLVLLFLEGFVILRPRGWQALALYLLLWLASYPVIFYGMCRKCANYGRRCPVPGEGNLVQHFFRRSEEPPGVGGYLMAGLCYLMRLGYPAVVLVRYEYPWSWSLLYGATVLAFGLLLGRVIGCPHCPHEACALNPRRRPTSRSSAP